MTNESATTLGLRIAQLAVSAVALMLTAYVVPGFRIGGFFSALIATFFIGIVNGLLRPLLLILTLPLNILTLGLFTFVVNGIILKLCAAFLPRFEIEGFFPAVIGAFVLALVNMGLHALFF